jgi:hypothetical protein
LSVIALSGMHVIGPMFLVAYKPIYLEFLAIERIDDNFVTNLSTY